MHDCMHPLQLLLLKNGDRMQLAYISVVLYARYLLANYFLGKIDRKIKEFLIVIRLNNFAQIPAHFTTS